MTPRRPATALAFLCALLPFASARADAPWEKVYERNQPGVVYILSEGLCSGALVADDLVLTAYHCVSGPRNIRVGYGKDVRRRGEYEYEEGVVVAAIAPRDDLAVLRLPRKHAARTLELAGPGHSFKPGQEVATIGHPSGISPLTSTGLFESQLFVLTRGLVAKANEDLVVADMLVLPGNSGGPVFEPGGAVVGVVSARHRDGDLGYFTPIPRVHEVIGRARASTGDARGRPFLGRGAVSLHVSLESDRYLAHAIGGRRNVAILAPSVTVWRLLRLTYASRVGPQHARKRHWDARLVATTEVSRLVDAEFSLGGGQAFYEHEENGQSAETKVVVLDAGLGGLRVGMAWPIKDWGRPAFSFGLDLFGLF